MNYGVEVMGHNKCCATSHCRDRLWSPSGSAARGPGGESQLQPGRCGSLCLSRGLWEPWRKDHFCLHRERDLENKYFVMHRYRLHSVGLLSRGSKQRNLKPSIAYPVYCPGCATYLGRHLALGLSAKPWRFRGWIGKISWIGNFMHLIFWNPP